MKKISVLIILALLFSSLSMLGVSAAEPKWIFECPKLVIPVTINGDGQGWEDAGEIIVNNDNPIFKQYGIWQGSEDRPVASSDLSVEYRLKWDETNFYILEKRFDKFHNVFDDINDDPGNAWPWMHSGTLFFLNYDTNFADPDRSGCYEVFWVNNGDTLVMTGRNVDKAQMFADEPEMAGIQIAGSRSGDTYITEVAIPWATMSKVSGFPAPTEGLKLRMTPVVSTFLEKTDDSGDRFGEKWNQLNFYTDPDEGAPDDPVSNGGMILVGATYTPPAPEPDPEPDAPAAAAPAPAPAPAAPAPAPQTGDNALVILALTVFAAGAFAVIRKKIAC